MQRRQRLLLRARGLAGLAVVVALGASSSQACAPASPESAGAPVATAVPPLTERVTMSAHYARLRSPSVAEQLLAGEAPTAADIARRRDEAARVRLHIERAGGVVVAHHKGLVHALQFVATDEVAAAVARRPEVRALEPVTRFERANAKATKNIGAATAWLPERGGLLGRGVRVGVIDTGIDYTHADFGGEGTKASFDANDPAVVEPGSFPTRKVTGGWDFAGDDYEPASGRRSPEPDADPLDCGGHGSHVAGTIAGVGVLPSGLPFTGSYAQSFEPGEFDIGPGMAPAAELFALKVFGCEGPTELIAAALERAADPNDDGDFADRLDVVNASLGAAYSLGGSVERDMVERLVALGTVFVAAAGNDGSDGRPYFTVGAPAAYPGALSVAATLNEEVTFSALEIVAPSSVAGTYPVTEAAFSRPLAQVGKLDARVVGAEPALGCASLTNASALAGNVALLRRGECLFVDKVRRAAEAGALAAIVVDNADADTPFAMGGAGGVRTEIAAVLMRARDGEPLFAAAEAPAVHFAPELRFPQSLGPDYVAGFSSRGPDSTAGAMKPEIAAPGSTLVSAAVGSGSGALRLGGTSMASPVVAGAAALAVEAHPDFSPRDVKALLMGAAERTDSFYGERFPLSLSGAGRVAVGGLAERFVLAGAAEGEAVGVAFGALTVGARTTEERTLRVENRGAARVALDGVVEFVGEPAGVELELIPRAIALDPGASATVLLRLTLDPARLGPAGDDGVTPGALRGSPRQRLPEVGGWARFVDRAGLQSTAVPFQAFVRPGGALRVDNLGHCSPPVVGAAEAPSRFEALLVGWSGPTPLEAQWVSVLELLAERPTEGVRAVGVTTDLGAVPADDARLFVGVALDAAWQTPARGPVPGFVVRLDTNGDGRADFTVTPTAASPGNESAPGQGSAVYADVMTARLTNTAGARAGEELLNVVTLEAADTRVFMNDVVVLPIRLRALGLEDAPNASIGVSVGLDGGAWLGSSTPFSRFVPSALQVLAPEDGPVVQASPERALRVPARLGDGASAGAALVLHHDNVADARVDSMPLAAAVPATSTDEDLEVVIDLASVIRSGDGARAIEIRVENAGLLEADGAWLELSSDDATLIAVALAGSACVVDASGLRGRCELGVLGPGATATATVTLGAADDAPAALVTTTGAENLCEADLADNRVEAVVPPPAPLGEQDAANSEYVVFPRGGCAASTTAAPSLPSRSAAVAALAVLLAASRRRRRR